MYSICHGLGVGWPLDKYQMLSINLSHFPERKTKGEIERDLWSKKEN